MQAACQGRASFSLLPLRFVQNRLQPNSCGHSVQNRNRWRLAASWGNFPAVIGVLCMAGPQPSDISSMAALSCGLRGSGSISHPLSQSVVLAVFHPTKAHPLWRPVPCLIADIPQSMILIGRPDLGASVPSCRHLTVEKNVGGQIYAWWQWQLHTAHSCLVYGTYQHA